MSPLIETVSAQWGRITREPVRFFAAGMIVALTASGCVGEIVETRRRVKGPVASVPWIDPGGGHARYALSGMAWMVRDRREDALSKIAGFCGGEGKAKIIDEVEREENEVPYTADEVEASVSSGEKHYRKAKYHHIYFECAP